MDKDKLIELVGEKIVDDTVLYDGFMLATEMLKFNLSDRKGLPRRYTKGYLVFASTLRNALGLSKYKKVRRLNFLPLPCPKTLSKYLRTEPDTPHPTEIDDQTFELLNEV